MFKMLRDCCENVKLYGLKKYNKSYNNLYEYETNRIFPAIFENHKQLESVFSIYM